MDTLYKCKPEAPEVAAN